MMTIISLLLLASLLPHLTFTADVDVGIVNGREAKPHSRPYMVSIQFFGHHICGGSLISNQWVLTAAHCWNRRMTLTVVVGAHDLRNSTSLSRISVKNYIPHPDYLICTLQNDIMLLMLQRKVRLNKNVGLIPLPKDSKDFSVDTPCSVAGWGRLWTTGLGSDRLMEVNVTALNHEECQSKWGPIYSALQMVCAYGGGGSCKGDSGGPLVCGDTAVGVTSFGDSKLCNSAERPNVYTKIAAYLPWIYQNIKKVK
ncbi:cathepsin G isoform X1 [Carassius gibelio]|uniref:cathepsin G isoform X1 n=1 Tax=Carassius gibelio TaxID=101364 RepID=UPI002278B1F5|nr:cathepsin G isoform X1 [Carassius gibelio]